MEAGDLNSAEVNYLLLQYLTEVKNSRADQLVLGCTHYPFIKKAIRKIVGHNVNLVDSGRAIAKHTQSLLLNNQLFNHQKKKGKSAYLTTGTPAQFSKVASKLLKRSIIKTRKIRI